VTACCILPIKTHVVSETLFGNACVSKTPF
jgi:hypothetical protein